MPVSHMLLIFFTGSLFGFFITSCAWYWSNKKIARAAQIHAFYCHSDGIAKRPTSSNHSTDFTEPSK